MLASNERLCGDLCENLSCVPIEELEHQKVARLLEPLSTPSCPWETISRDFNNRLLRSK